MSKKFDSEILTGEFNDTILGRAEKKAEYFSGDAFFQRLRKEAVKMAKEGEPISHILVFPQMEWGGTLDPKKDQAFLDSILPRIQEVVPGINHLRFDLVSNECYVMIDTKKNTFRRRHSYAGRAPGGA